MQWSADKNAGFSRANPQRLFLPIIIDPEYHYEAVNVEAQQNNPHSLLWWMRRIIGLRRRHPAFGRGTMEFLYPENRKVLAYIRRLGDEAILVVANLSRFAQHVELDLALERGRVPVELFSRNAFPGIGDRPYTLTLGPHAFLWFLLEPQEHPDPGEEGAASRPILDVRAPWTSALLGASREALERILPGFLPHCRWFRGKSRRILACRIEGGLVIPSSPHPTLLCILRAEFSDGGPETYVLPLAWVPRDRAQSHLETAPRSVLARLTEDGGPAGLLVDAAADPGFASALLDLVLSGSSLPGATVQLRAVRRPPLDRLLPPGGAPLAPAPLKGDQSNTSILYGDRLILKLYRRLEEGVSLDLEIPGFLTDSVSFPHTPDVAGWIEVERSGSPPATLAVLQAYVPNQGDAWRYTQDELERYFERILTRRPDLDLAPVPAGGLLDLTRRTPDPVTQETVASSLEAARLIGHRTADLHQALASSGQQEAFRPEPFTPLYQRSLYQSLRSLSARVLHSMRQSMLKLPPAVRSDAERLLPLESALLETCRGMLSLRIGGSRIRIHGDYHLGQLLHTGKDFVIIDFEGEPHRPLGERRIKRSPLRDVASMIRSFEYAASAAFLAQRDKGHLPAEKLPALRSWAKYWSRWTSSSFLRAYLDRAGANPVLPRPDSGFQDFLDLLLLEKALYELGYELDCRPDWAGIPLEAILHLVQAPHPERSPA